MFSLYSLMPVVIKESSAAAVNLSMLTADVFSIFCGIFIFHYNVSSEGEAPMTVTKTTRAKTVGG